MAIGRDAQKALSAAKSSSASKTSTNTAAQMAQQAGDRTNKYLEQAQTERKKQATASFSNEQKGNAVTITESSSSASQKRKPNYWTPSFSNEQKGNAVQNPRAKDYWTPTGNTSAMMAAQQGQKRNDYFREAADNRKATAAASAYSSERSSSSTTSKRPDSYYWTPKEPTGNTSAVMAAQAGQRTNKYLEKRETENYWTKRGQAQNNYWTARQHEEQAAEIRKEYSRRKSAEATQREEEELNLARVTSAANGNEASKAAIRGTALEAAAIDLSRRWGRGEAVSPVYRDGQIVFEGRPDQKIHYHYEVDSDGNWLSPSNQAQKNLNQELLNSGIMEHNGYIGTNLSIPDIVKNRTDLQKYKEGIEKGFTEDFEYSFEDGTTKKASEIIDMLLEEYDNKENRVNFSNLYEDYKSDFGALMMNSLAVDSEALKMNRDRAAQYAEELGKDSELGAVFAELSDAYGELYTHTVNAENSKVYSDLQEQLNQLKADEDELKNEETKILLTPLAIDTTRLKETRDNINANKEEQKALQTQLAEWQPNTNEERDALIEKMHTNAGKLKGGLTEEEQARLLELDTQLGNPDIDYGKDFTKRSKAVKGFFMQGIEGITRFGSRTFNFLANGLPKVFNKPAKWLVEHSDLARDVDAFAYELFRPLQEGTETLDEYVGKVQELDAAYYAANFQGDKMGETLNKYVPMVIQAVPMALVANATSVASPFFGTTMYGDTVAAASTVAQASGLERLAIGCGQAIKSVASDPNFQITFLQELGTGYYEAIEDGASDLEAVAYAIMNATANAGIEIGGGTQTLPDEIKLAINSGKKEVLKEAAKSIVEEVVEETTQGMASSAIKGIYNAVPLYSKDDENAIINPNRMLEEAKGAAVVSAVLGAPNTVSGLKNTRSRGAVYVDENGRVHVNTNRGKTSNDRRDVVIANAAREGVGLNPVEETNAPTREEQVQAEQDKAIDLEQAERAAAEEEYQAEQEARLAGIEENNRLEEESKYTDENDMSKPESEEDVSDEDLAQIRHDISEEEYLDSLGTKGKPGEPATASETAQGEAQGSTPTETASDSENGVKPLEESPQEKKRGRTEEEKAKAKHNDFENQKTAIEQQYSEEELETSKGLYSERASDIEGVKVGDTLRSQNMPGITAKVVDVSDNGISIAVYDEDGNEIVPLDKIPFGYMPKGSAYITYDLTPDTTQPAAVSQAAQNAKATVENTQQAMGAQPRAQADATENSSSATTAMPTTEEVREAERKIKSGETNEKTVAEIVPDVDPFVSSREPVKTINENAFAKTGEPNEPTLRQKVWNFFKSHFNGVIRDAKAGPVIINERGIRNDIAHGVGEAKAATFEAVPDVLRSGDIVSRSTGGENGKSYTIAGKVMLNGTPVNVYCVVKENGVGTNKFYLHEVSDGQGNLYYQINQNKEAPSAFQDSTLQSQGSADKASTPTVPQTEQSSNSETSTAQSQSGIMEENEGGINNGKQERSVNGRSDTRRNREPKSTDRAAIGRGETESNQPIYETPPFPDGTNRRARKWYKNKSFGFQSRGHVLIKRSEWGEALKALETWAKKQGCAFFTVFDGRTGTGTIGSSSAYANVGVFGSHTNMGHLGETLVHEIVHDAISRFCQSKKRTYSRRSVINGLVQDRIVDADIIDSAFDEMAAAWGADYLWRFVDKSAVEEFSQLSDTESKMQWLLDNVSEEYMTLFASDIYEEMICEIASGEDNWFEGNIDIDKATQYVRGYLIKEGIFKDGSFVDIDTLIDQVDDEMISAYPPIEEDLSGIQPTEYEQSLQEENEALKQRIAELEAQQQQPEESRPQPSTRKKPQQQSLKEDTQTKGSIRNFEERARDIAEEFGLSDGTYQSATRKEVSRIADYCIEKYGMENEWDRLMNKKTWDRVDFSEAGKIVLEMTKNLNRDMTRNGNRGLGKVLEKKAGETYEQYSNRQEVEDKRAYQERREPIDALLQQYADQKSVRGQELQETYNFTFADELRMRASHRFLNYSRDGEVRNATDNAKSAKMWAIIDDLVTRVENAEESGSAKDLVEITKMVGRIRGRENLLGKTGTRAENWMFDRMLKLGVEKDALAALAYGNIGKVMDDLTPITYADAIQTVRVTNMLSNIATGLNNLANNAISLRTQSLAQNASIPFAKAFEKLTGKKIAISDSSVFRGKDIRKAEEAALEYSILSSYYGMASEDGRVDLDNKGTNFYVNGTGLSGMAARALARYNFLVQAFVLNPDAPAKARARFGLQKGIEKAFEGAENTPETIRNRKELEGYAAKETNRRVLQEDNTITNAVLYFKNHLLNKAKTPGEHVKVGGRELGSFKLGDFVMAFAKVPTNVGIQKLEATPYGALYQTIRYAGALAKAKANPESMTTNEMARISRDIGRAATTAGMIGLGALAAMTGALKNFDDTDDDEEKKLAREKGYSGLMLNLSQIFHGGEWQDDDLIVSGNFLEILATPLTIGAMMYDASKEGMGFLDSMAYGTKKSFTGMVDAVMDIPGLQQIGDLWTSYANQKPDDGDFDKAMKAIGQFAVSSGTSYFIPNLVAQATAGADNKQRDIYTTDSYAETLRNIVMAKTPGLRKMLPEKTDTFGNTRTYGETKLGSILNTVVFPGDFKRYHVSEVETEMRRLAKEGYGKTWFDTTGPKKVEVDDDEYPLTADQRRAYHEAKAHHLLEAYDAFRTSDEYKSLTDAQRAEVYKQLRTNAEHIVKQEFMTAAEIEGEVSMSKWETLPDLDSKIRALSAKQLAGNYFDKSENEVTDYEGMDKFIKGDYAKLSDEEKDVVNSTYTYLDDIEDARENGINSEKWEMAHNIFNKYNKPDEDGNKPEANLVNSAEMWSEIQKATGFDDNGEEMQYIQDKMHLSFQGRPNTSTYDELINDYGMSRESAAKVYAKFDPLQPTEGYSTVQDRQKWNALVESGISDKEQWDAFFAMVPTNNTKQIANMHSLQGKMNPRTLKPYTFKEAIHQFELDVVYRKETLPNGKTKKYAIN